MGYFKSEGNPIGEFVLLKITSANGISLYGERVLSATENENDFGKERR
jgi:hypothetical protein